MDNEKTRMEQKPFHQILGAPLYFSTRIRPDFSTAVFMVVKYQEEAQLERWRMVKHIFEVHAKYN